MDCAVNRGNNERQIEKAKERLYVASVFRLKTKATLHLDGCIAFINLDIEIHYSGLKCYFRALRISTPCCMIAFLVAKETPSDNPL